MSSLLEESHVAPDASSSNSVGADTPLIKSFQRRRDIGGVSTELLIQTFDDRILVIVTQVGKVGCLIQTSLPPSIPLPPPFASNPASNGHTTTSILSSLPPPPPGISLTPLLGTPPNQTLYELYSSQIATIVWWTLQTSSTPRRPVVLGLALKRSLSDSPREEWDSDAQAMDEHERNRFAGIMGMVGEWEG